MLPRPRISRSISCGRWQGRTRRTPAWRSTSAGGGEGGDLLLHPVRDAGVHGGASREDDVGVEVLPDVHVALHDGVVGGLVHPAALHPDERGLEQGLWGLEPLV